ncbi:MAG TPA: DUF3472 domain-containing protein [Dongiaceae bacterium]|nr:DUF3472 domain-containing protein [Dongiaceae bacterium]
MSGHMPKWLFLLAAVGLLGARPARAQHLWWHLEGAGPATCLYGEITVLATQPTTYYCGANWHPGEPAGGYCGIQHNGPEERRTIFSIWDTAATLHPRVTFTAPDVVGNRFGGEGEGAHTHLVWNWETNATFQFFVRKQPGAATNTTDTAYYIFDPAGQAWRQLATITSPNGGYPAVTNFGGGLNSFLENFSGQDPAAPRLALYRLWLGPDAAHLQALTRATGDGTWGRLHDAYFLASGATNALNTVLAGVEAAYGPPEFGRADHPVPPLTARAVAPAIITALQKISEAGSPGAGVRTPPSS